MSDSQDSFPEPFLQTRQELEEAYFDEDEPTRQFRLLGGKDRWRRERAIILAAVQEDGDFVDVGCANSSLVECLVRWAREKRIALTPYGIDQGVRLVELAKQRSPEYACHFWMANAWDWLHPRRSRYVYTRCAACPLKPDGVLTMKELLLPCALLASIALTSGLSHALGQFPLISHDVLFGSPDKAAVRITPDGAKLSCVLSAQGDPEPRLTNGPQDLFTTAPVNFGPTREAVSMKDKCGRNTAALACLYLERSEAALIAQNGRVSRR